MGTKEQHGNSTGIHLHLEMQDLSSRGWIFGADLSEYLNPADFMGFPNEAGISVIYNGTPSPPEPPAINLKKNKFKWVLFSQKLRNNRHNF